MHYVQFTLLHPHPLDTCVSSLSFLLLVSISLCSFSFLGPPSVLHLFIIHSGCPSMQVNKTLMWMGLSHKQEKGNYHETLSA